MTIRLFPPEYTIHTLNSLGPFGYSYLLRYREALQRDGYDGDTRHLGGEDFHRRLGRFDQLTYYELTERAWDSIAQLTGDLLVFMIAPNEARWASWLPPIVARRYKNIVLVRPHDKEFCIFQPKEWGCMCLVHNNSYSACLHLTKDILQNEYGPQIHDQYFERLRSKRT